MTAPTILLVEDDPSLRMLTARALQENGFSVRPASAAPEMWLALDSGPVDLVLLDIMLPGTSGIDLCRSLRQKSDCLLYTSPSPRDGLLSRMPSSA